MLKEKYKRGVTAGAFDLVHRGHVMMFKECKKSCNHLEVFLQTDPSIDRPEKHSPIMSVEERLTILRSIKFIDSITIYRTEADLLGLLKKQPAGTVRIIGADWKGKKFTGWDLPLPIIFNSRGHHYSTSELRRRIYLAEKQLEEEQREKTRAARVAAAAETEVRVPGTANSRQPASSASA